MVTIFILSSISGQSLEPYMLHFRFWDKVCHAIAFASGAVILAMALHKTTSLPPRALVLLVIVVISIFGATDEWHQLGTPGRSGADVFDWLADTLGATLGALVNYAGNRVTENARASQEVAAGN